MIPANAPAIPAPPCIAAINQPPKAPLITRKVNPTGPVRDGVFGSTSRTYSATTAIASTMPHALPRRMNTAASGVNVRRPETIPRQKASKSAVTGYRFAST